MALRPTQMELFPFRQLSWIVDRLPTIKRERNILHQYIKSPYCPPRLRGKGLDGIFCGVGLVEKTVFLGNGISVCGGFD